MTRSFADVHQHHAGGRAEHQREVLGAFEVLALQVARRQQQREERREQHDGLREHREAVDRDHADVRRSALVSIVWYGPLSCTNAHWMPVNTAAVNTPRDRDRSARPRGRAGRAGSSERSSTMISGRPNSAIGGAIANQSIDGAVMCVDGREHGDDHLPGLR